MSIEIGTNDKAAKKLLMFRFQQSWKMMEKAYWFYSCNGKKVGICLVTMTFFFPVKVFCFASVLMFSQVEIIKIYMHE